LRRARARARVCDIEKVSGAANCKNSYQSLQVCDVTRLYALRNSKWTAAQGETVCKQSEIKVITLNIVTHTHARARARAQTHAYTRATDTPVHACTVIFECFSDGECCATSIRSNHGAHAQNEIIIPPVIAIWLYVTSLPRTAMGATSEL
jgi:hypothetical protein